MKQSNFQVFTLEMSIMLTEKIRAMKIGLIIPTFLCDPKFFQILQISKSIKIGCIFTGIFQQSWQVNYIIRFSHPIVFFPVFGVTEATTVFFKEE